VKHQKQPAYNLEEQKIDVHELYPPSEWLTSSGIQSGLRASHAFVLVDELLTLSGRSIRLRASPCNSVAAQIMHVYYCYLPQLLEGASVFL